MQLQICTTDHDIYYNVAQSMQSLTIRFTSVSILLFHCLVTHPSASDSFAT